MWNFQSIIFIWTQTYREIFKSASYSVSFPLAIVYKGVIEIIWTPWVIISLFHLWKVHISVNFSLLYSCCSAVNHSYLKSMFMEPHNIVHIFLFHSNQVTFKRILCSWLQLNGTMPLLCGMECEMEMPARENLDLLVLFPLPYQLK